MRGARARRRCGALFAAVLAGPLAGAPARAADSISSFNAVSSAYAFDATLVNPQTIPVVSAVEIAGPTAQAHLSSLSDSDSFASFPYPGQDVVGVPGLVAALFGVPAPPYPAYVSTSLGDKPADKQLPGVTLHAESEQSQAAASAMAGPASATNATSTAHATQDGDGVSTITDTAVDGLNIAGVLRVSGLQAHTEASRDSSAKLTTGSHISFGQLTVPGLSLTIPTSTPAQVPIPIPIPFLPQPPPINLPVLPVPAGGTTIAAPDLGFEDGAFTVTLPEPNGKPATFAVPAQPVLDALAQAGVTVTYQAPHPLLDKKGKADGIEGAGITFTYVATEPPPPLNSQLHGKTTISVTVGRATSQVDLAPAAGFGDAGSTPVVPIVGPLTTSAAPATETSGMGGSSVPNAGTLSGGDLSGALGTGTAGVSAGPAPVVAGSQPSPAALAPAALAHGKPLTDSADIYLLLVVAAAAALGALQIIRLLGVRHPCGS